MPWFEVLVIGSQTLAVEAGDAEEAERVALDEAFSVGSSPGTLDAQKVRGPLTGSNLERVRRHADLVLPDLT